MKRTLVLAIVALALAAAIADYGSAAGRSKPTSITFHLRSQILRAHYVDNPPAGPSAGDDLVFTEKLINAAGKTIGTDAASCVSLFDQRSICTGAYILPHGQVLVQLVQPGPTGTYSQVIAGGTGSYARATGTVTDNQSPNNDHFTFHIQLPIS